MDSVPPKSPPPHADQCGTPEATAQAAKARGARGGRGNARSGGPEAEAARRAREERLAAIRRAVEAGEYDSDELLEKALERMIHRIRSSED